MNRIGRELAESSPNGLFRWLGAEGQSAGTFTYNLPHMRSNIDIDEALLRQALKVSGLASKKAVVEEGLRLLVNVHGQRSLSRFRGKIVFDDDILDEKE